VASAAGLSALEIASSVHVICDLTVGLGKVVLITSTEKPPDAFSQTSWRRDRRAGAASAGRSLIARL
jgi:hypothetical protein